MTTVTMKDIVNSVQQLGVLTTDSLIVHSSLKSLGYVDGGPEAVIAGLQQAVADGTLIFPTLCQKDWAHVYENWHMDAPSDVGLLTNVFRKMPGALRSNQATHSVAAIGKDAAYITQTHGVTGKRPGIFGDTPFAADSPWEKMYEMNTKMLFLGVTPMAATMRHYAEYRFVDDSLKAIASLAEYEEMKNSLWYYGNAAAAWPQIWNLPLSEYMAEQGLVKVAQCGDATLTCIEAKSFVDFSIKAMEEVDLRFIRDIGICYEETLQWLERMKQLKAKL